MGIHMCEHLAEDFSYRVWSKSDGLVDPVEPAECRFTGDAKLTEWERLRVARMVMFLHTDAERKKNLLEWGII